MPPTPVAEGGVARALATGAAAAKYMGSDMGSPADIWVKNMFRNWLKQRGSKNE